MQTSPAIEQRETLNGPRVRGISPVGKEKVYGTSDVEQIGLELPLESVQCHLRLSTTERRL